MTVNSSVLRLSPTPPQGPFGAKMINLITYESK